MSAAFQDSILVSRRFDMVRGILRAYGALFGMAVVLGILELIRPNFLSGANIEGVLRQSSILVVMSMGLTVAMALRGVDLSFAQVTDASGLLAAALLVQGDPTWCAFVYPVLLGLVVGCVNAVLMAYIGIPAIIGTLGMMFIVRSGELLYSHGAEPQILFSLPSEVTENFFLLGRHSIGSVPLLIIFEAAMVLIAYALMTLTPFARYVRAVGSNVRAAYLAGVNVRLIFGAGFVVSAMMAAVAGVALVSRTGIAVPRGAEPYMLDAFAAVYLGTLASPRSEMNVVGSLIGALFVAFLGNGLTIMGLGAPFRYALNGGFMLLAMAVGALRRES
jgi:ribose/xylose/arabinose/galactoside ABC-type transport system permease subunit